MEFRDLKKQYTVLKSEIDRKIKDVCETADFISGNEVRSFEKKLAQYVGVKHCISCANGTDAITLALKAWRIGEGDAVFVPDFTFFSSAECPAAEGATCVFVDVDNETYNINPTKLEESIKMVIAEGKYIPKVVIAVDLFGQPADYLQIRKICNKYNLLLLEDGAQGLGGKINEKKACSFGDISTTSFFPAKPLGCYGDGGAIFTDNDDWAKIIRSMAVHGKNADDKYDNITIGMNSRLDTIQAAILNVKIQAFIDYELSNINKIADWYTEELKKILIQTPIVREGYLSSWAQYTIKLEPNIDRKKLQQHLKEEGIPTMVYYVKPMHLQGAFSELECVVTDCSVSEKLCEKVLSLPIHPYMTREDVVFVTRKINEVLKKMED